MTKISSVKRRKLIGQILRIAVLCILSFFILMPIVLTITNSFMSKSEITANYGKIFTAVTSDGGKTYVSEHTNLKLIPDIFSLYQYSTVLFRSPQYLLKFWNSVILVVPIVVFQVVLALFSAYGFSRFQGKIRSVIFFTYIMLMLMPYQVTLVPNYLVSDWLGIINTRWAIILPGVFSPFAVFILTKSMKRIPISIIEAAELDGAGEFNIFLRISVPMAKSAIYSVIILVFIDYWNMVEQPLVLLKDTELHPLSVFLSQINAGDAGLAFAVAVIYMIIPILSFLYGEAYLIEGISYSGGIKG